MHVRAGDGVVACTFMPGGSVVGFRAAIADLRIGIAAAAAAEGDVAARLDRDRTRIRPAGLIAAIADLREFAGRVSAGERNRSRGIHNNRARSSAVEAELCVAIV